jgi:hypothetical protein
MSAMGEPKGRRTRRRATEYGIARNAMARRCKEVAEGPVAARLSVVRLAAPWCDGARRPA